MELSRRDVVGLCGGLTAGLGGCLSGGSSNVRYPEPLAGGDAALVGDSETAADRENATQTDGGPAPNQRLAAGVRRIDEELAWFATEYDSALDAYRAALDRATATIERIRDDADFNGDSLELVESAARNVRRTAEVELAPHFAIHNRIADRNENHLSTVRKFAERRDLDRTDEELARLAAFYRRIGTDLFIRQYLSDRQIDNRLYRWLRGDGTRPGLFELYHGPTRFSAYAYDGPEYIEREPFDDAALSTVRDHFDPVQHSTDREMHAYVRTYAVPAEGEQPSPLKPTEYDWTALFVQRYADGNAAGAALETLLDGPVTQEGAYSFGPETWRRIYYTTDGDVVYAFAVHAGPYLVVAAPSEVAWEERVDWSEPLSRTLLWTR